MKVTLYISENGAQLKRYGLIIKIIDRKGNLIREIPIININEIVMIGRIQLTSSVLDLCFQRNISLIYLTQTGEYKYTITPFNKKQVELRFVQYKKYSDEFFRVNFSKKIVSAKIRNQRVFLQRYGRKGNRELLEKIYLFKALEKKLNFALTIDEVMGIEGSAATTYFRSWPLILNDDWNFERRIKRPPTDPVNVLLSFGYTILFKKVLSAVRISGLDPFIGFLHSLLDRRESLALDLMEEFRIPIIDSVVVSLLNKRMIKEEHFFKKENKLFLSREGIAIYLGAIYQRLKSPISFQEKKMIYEQLIKYQVNNFKKSLATDREYIAFCWR